ncbi:tRNA guanosine(34) transglycosylase Tgt [Candidatus Beckwithbacteria bacterium]|nr:tRNA guanosine(34) transglycosylase Tgt [Candidatus Beckwithbacteria bacterium]
MLEFKILKKSTKSRARLGVLKTAHGEVETPAFVPVTTQAAAKALSSEEIKEAGSQLVICNTFHLHLKPGEDYVQQAGKLHEFMHWERPIMTDSAGFQVFSLGFGVDHGVGKKIKKDDGKKLNKTIKQDKQPKNLKITDDGVLFKSPLNGDKIFIGPKESIAIQQKLGADIMFAFDECTSPLANKDYIKKSMERTHRWAKICLEHRSSDQALFGIVQGSYFQDFRQESAQYINSLDFDGFGIGGDLGISKDDTRNVLNWNIPFLDEQKPRHLLGMGYLDDMQIIVEGGVDTFDCTVPTQFGRHGIAFTSEGKLDMRKAKYFKDQEPLDKNCACPVCQNYKRSYLCHLLRAKEITGLRFLSLHNIYFFNNYIKILREKIKNNEI